MRVVLALLVLTAPSFAQQSGRVEGRVLSTTGEPVAKVTVRLNSNPQPLQQGSAYVEVTSSDGRFAVENIAPGRYTATAQRVGYTPARTAAGAVPLLSIEVTPGETKTGIEIRLTPLAVLSGVVTDADGDPVPNPQVRLLRYNFNQGRLMLTPGTTASGDDRGIFRLLNVQPGRYYLAASGGIVPGTSNEIRGRSAQEVNLQTFYPNSPEVRGAIAITVGSTEVSNLNIRLRRGATYSIKGNSVDASGAPVAGQITVFPKGGDALPQGASTQVRNVGEFQVGGLPPGDYTIVMRSTASKPAAPPPPPAISPGPAVVVRPAAQTTVALSGRLDVSIGSANLENVTIRMTQGARVSGRLVIEGGIDLPTFMASLPIATVQRPDSPSTSVAVALTPLPAGQQPRMPSITLLAMEGPNAQLATAVANDGTFAIENVPPLKRILQIGPLPPSSYVKSVRLGGQDVTRTPLDLSAGADGVLEIVISTKGAMISPVPRTDKGELPQGGAAVTIWPRVPNNGSATGDVRNYPAAAQAFQAQGLAPGDYYVAAWETANAEYLRMPEFLARFTALATRVTVAEGESVTAEPKVISREAMEKEMAQYP